MRGNKRERERISDDKRHQSIEEWPQPRVRHSSDYGDQTNEGDQSRQEQAIGGNDRYSLGDAGQKAH